MADGRRFKRTVKSPHLYNRLTDFDKIWQGDAYCLLTADWSLKFRILNAHHTQTHYAVCGIRPRLASAEMQHENGANYSPCVYCQVYCVPPDADRLSLSVTVLLAFSVFQFVVNDITPVSSDTTPVVGLCLASSAFGLHVGWSDLTESMVTIRSPFCGYNSAYCVELKGEDLWSYSHKIESVSLRKCPYGYYLTNNA